MISNKNNTKNFIMNIIPFFLKSGLPFLTVAITISPTPAAGNLFNRPWIPLTEITYKFLAPELSAQFMTAPTGRPKVIRNLLPEAKKKKKKRNILIKLKKKNFLKIKINTYHHHAL